MKSKLFIALSAVVISVLVASTYVKSTNKTAQEVARPRSRGGLAQLVKKAKEKGETRLELHGTISNRAQYTNLDDALKSFYLVKVEVISKKTVVEDGEFINTWYKFRVIDTLSKAKTSHNFSFMTPPPEMLPLQEDEILVPVDGGNATIDGVEVSSGELGQPGERAFDEHQKYLLLLLVDPVSKIGTTDLGSAGVFTVSDDDTFTPFDGDKRRVYDELKTSSVGELKERLKHSR